MGEEIVVFGEEKGGYLVLRKPDYFGIVSAIFIKEIVGEWGRLGVQSGIDCFFFDEKKIGVLILWAENFWETARQIWGENFLDTIGGSKLLMKRSHDIFLTKKARWISVTKFERFLGKNYFVLYCVQINLKVESGAIGLACAYHSEPINLFCP